MMSKRHYYPSVNGSKLPSVGLIVIVIDFARLSLLQLKYSPAGRRPCHGHDLRLYSRRGTSQALPACPAINLNNYGNTDDSQEISLYRIYRSVNTKDFNLEECCSVTPRQICQITRAQREEERRTGRRRSRAPLIRLYQIVKDRKTRNFLLHELLKVTPLELTELEDARRRERMEEEILELVVEGVVSKTMDYLLSSKEAGVEEERQHGKVGSHRVVENSPSKGRQSKGKSPETRKRRETVDDYRGTSHAHRIHDYSESRSRESREEKERRRRKSSRDSRHRLKAGKTLDDDVPSSAAVLEKERRRRESKSKSPNSGSRRRLSRKSPGKDQESGRFMLSSAGYHHDHDHDGRKGRQSVAEKDRSKSPAHHPDLLPSKSSRQNIPSKERQILHHPDTHEPHSTPAKTTDKKSWQSFDDHSISHHPIAYHSAQDGVPADRGKKSRQSLIAVKEPAKSDHSVAQKSHKSRQSFGADEHSISHHPLPYHEDDLTPQDHTHAAHISAGEPDRKSRRKTEKLITEKKQDDLATRTEPSSHYSSYPIHDYREKSTHSTAHRGADEEEPHYNAHQLHDYHENSQPSLPVPSPRKPSKTPHGSSKPTATTSKRRKHTFEHRHPHTPWDHDEGMGISGSHTAHDVKPARSRPRTRKSDAVASSEKQGNKSSFVTFDKTAPTTLRKTSTLIAIANHLMTSPLDGVAENRAVSPGGHKVAPVHSENGDLIFTAPLVTHMDGTSHVDTQKLTRDKSVQKHDLPTEAMAAVRSVPSITDEAGANLRVMVSSMIKFIQTEISKDSHGRLKSPRIQHNIQSQSHIHTIAETPGEHHNHPQPSHAKMDLAYQAFLSDRPVSEIGRDSSIGRPSSTRSLPEVVSHHHHPEYHEFLHHRAQAGSGHPPADKHAIHAEKSMAEDPRHKINKHEEHAAFHEFLRLRDPSHEHYRAVTEHDVQPEKGAHDPRHHIDPASENAEYLEFLRARDHSHHHGHGPPSADKIAIAASGQHPKHLLDAHVENADYHDFMRHREKLRHGHSNVPEKEDPPAHKSQLESHHLATPHTGNQEYLDFMRLRDKSHLTPADVSREQILTGSHIYDHRQSVDRGLDDSAYKEFLRIDDQSKQGHVASTQEASIPIPSVQNAHHSTHHLDPAYKHYLGTRMPSEHGAIPHVPSDQPDRPATADSITRHPPTNAPEYLEFLRLRTISEKISPLNLQQASAIKEPAGRRHSISHEHHHEFQEFLRGRTHSETGNVSMELDGKVSTQSRPDHRHSVHREHDHDFHDFLRGRAKSETGHIPADLTGQPSSVVEHHPRHSINLEHDPNFHEFLRTRVSAESGNVHHGDPNNQICKDDINAHRHSIHANRHDLHAEYLEFLKLRANSDHDHHRPPMSVTSEGSYQDPRHDHYANQHDHHEDYQGFLRGRANSDAEHHHHSAIPEQQTSVIDGRHSIHQDPSGNYHDFLRQRGPSLTHSTPINSRDPSASNIPTGNLPVLGEPSRDDRQVTFPASSNSRPTTAPSTLSGLPSSVAAIDATSGRPTKQSLNEVSQNVLYGEHILLSDQISRIKEENSQLQSRLSELDQENFSLKLSLQTAPSGSTLKDEAGNRRSGSPRGRPNYPVAARASSERSSLERRTDSFQYDEKIPRSGASRDKSKENHQTARESARFSSPRSYGSEFFKPSEKDRSVRQMASSKGVDKYRSDRQAVRLTDGIEEMRARPRTGSPRDYSLKNQSQPGAPRLKSTKIQPADCQGLRAALDECAKELAKLQSSYPGSRSPRSRGRSTRRNDGSCCLDDKMLDRLARTRIVPSGEQALEDAKAACRCIKGQAINCVCCNCRKRSTSCNGESFEALTSLFKDDYVVQRDYDDDLVNVSDFKGFIRKGGGSGGTVCGTVKYSGVRTPTLSPSEKVEQVLKRHRDTSSPREFYCDVYKL